MADFSFNPVFHHAPWQDNVDRCEAGGPNGFNIRFTTIENDLKTLSTVVGQVGTDIDQINTKITPPAATTLTLAPTLLPVAGSTAWGLTTAGHAAAPTAGGSGGPAGVVPLTLPNGVKLTSMRVRGTGVPPTGQNTSFFLTRVSLSDGTVATVASYDTSTVALGNAFTITSTNNQVDIANFRYVVSISTGSAAGLSNPVTLWAIQVTYTTS